MEQNHLLDSFLTTTSTKSELESTSFLSSLDMDPGGSGINAAMTTTTAATGTTQMISGSPVSLPSSNSNNNNSSGPGGADSIFGVLGSPTTNSGSHTPTTTSNNSNGVSTEQKREVFQDFKRLMSFGLRRDSHGVGSTRGL
jgi:hypothetical protein